MPTLTGKKIKNTYANLLQISQVGNTGIDGTIRDIEDGFGVATPIEMSTTTFKVTGLFSQVVSLLAATGDETAFSMAYTVNKLTSGDDYGIKLVRTNTSSPGTSYFLKIAGYSDTYPYLNIQEYGSGYAISYEGAGGGNYTRFEFSNLDMVGINSANGCIVHTAGGFYDGNRAIFGANWNGVQLGDIYQISWANGHGVDATRYGPWDTGLVRSSAGVVKVTGGGSNFGSLSSGNITVNGLVTPAAPVITQGGTPGATTYGYKVVAKLRDGSVTLPSAEGTTATGHATLDGTNYNIITWVAVAGAVNYDVYRSTGGATQGLIISGGSSPQNDTGFAAAGAEPTINTTGRLVIQDSSYVYHKTGIYNGGGGEAFSVLFGWHGEAGGLYIWQCMYAGSYPTFNIRGNRCDHSMILTDTADYYGEMWKMGSNYTYKRAIGNTYEYGFYNFVSGYGELQASSDHQSFFTIAPNWNQSGTAGNEDLLIKRTNTGIGSGPNYFLRLAIGATTKFSLDTAGNLNVDSAAQVKFSTDVGLARITGGVARISDGSTGYGNLQMSAGAARSYLGVQVNYGGDYEWIAFPTYEWITAASQRVWGSGTSYASYDTGLARAAAGSLKVTDGSTHYGALTAGVLTPTTVGPPATVTVTPQGTPGATTWYYLVAAQHADGSRSTVATGFTATGNAVLDINNFNRITWDAVSGATGYYVYRGSGAAQGRIANLLVGLTLDDTGLAETSDVYLGQSEGIVLNSPYDKIIVDNRAGTAPDEIISVVNNAVVSPQLGRYSTAWVFGGYGILHQCFIDQGIIGIHKDGQYKWSDTAYYATSGGSSLDTGLGRSAAGVVKITDGSTGYGALRLDADTTQVADTVTLADNVDTAILDIALADTKMVGATIHYTVKCVDATPNYQVEQGTINVLAFNKSGTTTATLTSSATQLLGSGTLTTAWTAIDGTNKVTVKLTANSSLTPTALTVVYQAFINHDGAVTKKA